MPNQYHYIDPEYAYIWHKLRRCLNLRQYFFLLLIVLSLTSCKTVLTTKKNIEKITIEELSSKKEIEIYDSSEIEKIVKKVNRCYREPYIFRAEYELNIWYKDSTSIDILVKDNIIKINGLTYRTKKLKNVIDKCWKKK